MSYGCEFTSSLADIAFIDGVNSHTITLLGILYNPDSRIIRLPPKSTISQTIYDNPPFYLRILPFLCNLTTYPSFHCVLGWLPSHWMHSTSSHSVFETTSVDLDKIPRHSQPDRGICLTVPCFARMWTQCCQ